MVPQQPDLIKLDKILTQISQVEGENGAAYDKAILTLSGGALALSLAFIKDVVAPATAQHNCLLYAAWALLVLALASNISAFLTAMRSFMVQRTMDRSLHHERSH